MVGIVKVVKEAHPDFDRRDRPMGMRRRGGRRPTCRKPVTLAEIKANPKLKDMVLVRNSRLSVQPVSPQEWSIICKLGGLAKPPQA